MRRMSRRRHHHPQTKKLRGAEFEKDLAEITSESDEYDPTGKTQEQLDAMIAKYHRDVKASRMDANRRRMLEGINTACPVCHMHVSSHRRSYTEASQAEQRDAAFVTAPWKIQSVHAL